MLMFSECKLPDDDKIDLSRCYAKLDKFLDAKAIRAREVAAACVPAPENAPWFVIRVMSGKENAVENLFKEAGIECAVPVRKGPIRRRRNMKLPTEMLPVIMGYVFARCAFSNEAIRGLLGFESVLSLLGGYENPHMVAYEKINELNGKASTGVYDWDAPAAFTLRAGMSVMITEGPFAGAKAVVVTGISKTRGDAILEIEFLGGVVTAMMPLAILKPL